MSRKNKKIEAEQEQLMKDIKEMEKRAREEALQALPQEEKKDESCLFDAWYAMRASQIPGRHMKEILRADFEGRGLGNKETIAKYDMALEKYGVKLK